MVSTSVSPLEPRARVLRHFSRVGLFTNLWTAARQAPLSMALFHQESWSGLPCLPPGDLPNSGIEPRFPVLQADCLPSEPPGKWMNLENINAK